MVLDQDCYSIVPSTTNATSHPVPRTYHSRRELRSPPQADHRLGPDITSELDSAGPVESPPVLLRPPVSSTPTMLPAHADMVSRLWNGFVAVVIALVAQLLLAGIHSLLDSSEVDFPPTILAMTGVFVLLSVCGCIMPGVDSFYRKHLQGAVSLLCLAVFRDISDLWQANLLNRHMSIGFTIPFVMICRSSLASPQTIKLIVLCFSRSLLCWFHSRI